MLAIFWLLSAAGACAAFYCGSALGLVAYIVVLCGLRNLWLYFLAKAGPRTTRQIPPQPIARCQQLSAQELSAAYRAGTLSCAYVVQTYIEHIKRVNPYINALVFECFDEAVKSAVKADEIWAAWRADPSKPEPSWLLGVPCTIKECMLCKGCPNTSGYPCRENFIAEEDSPVVHNFREAGAIILGVTNTSELCMWYESSNYVYGITSNPYDTRCLVGGSSGGEGAAAAAAFATFGVGSDIGGSIRMPAFFNGVFGHKSTPHYIANRGQHPGAKSSANHYMATGPITRFVEDIIPLSQIAARGGFREDPREFPQTDPLKKVLDLRRTPLRVYALEDFGLPCIHVSQSQLEAVHTAAEALRREYGAEVTYVNVRNPSRCSGGRLPAVFKPFARVLSMWSSALTSDPTETKFSVLMSEGYNTPTHNWVAEIFAWAVGRSRHTLPAIMLSVIETLEIMLPSFLTISRKGIVEPFKADLEALLGENGVIIAPTFPTAAPRHHAPIWNPFQFQYTAAFNVLQLPATALPVWGDTEVGGVKSISIAEEKAKHLPEDCHLPKGVQVVGATNRDELCVTVAIAIKEMLGGYRYPSWAELEGIDF